MNNPTKTKPVIVRWEIDNHNSCDIVARIHCGYATAKINLERLNKYPLLTIIEQEQTDHGCSILGDKDS